MGQTDIAGQNAHPYALPERVAAIAHPQAAAGKVDAHQMPLRIAFGNDFIDHHTGVLAEFDRQIEARERLAGGPAASALPSCRTAR